MFGGGGDPLQAAIGGGSGGGGMMSSLSQRPSQQSQTLMAMQHHQQQQQDTSMYIGCLFLCCQCFASVKYSLHVMKLLLLKLLSFFCVTRVLLPVICFLSFSLIVDPVMYPSEQTFSKDSRRKSKCVF